MKYAICLILCTFASSAFADQKYSYDQFLKAVREVETGSWAGKGEGAKGDNGDAIGPFQIHKGYWKDATDHDPRIGGSYADCKGYDYSLKIVKAYLDRYCRDAVQKGNWERASRIHNGGPEGDMKASTLPYWQKVKAKLQK